ncbi:histidine phosphatase family protein [Tessaracoccus flavus]|uniref:Uncharacterized protein n=1 Tax=Tessaracoccus flavus TaxID=1610493 RepID=A0A1Q2CDK3_9ACTN|nr:histidine phosphatase family protein [Tessaracoccus flavus]AQP44203.1 hypothetical protein RPIT_04705 [Tessaracoccus flavus]SDY38086.1 alpha-ribazole phosphatase/probable phosphoglycerate mutase [Tessaracoccus flavus]
MTPRPDTQLVVLRHGETDWNRDRRFQGHADIPLNDAGRQQAVKLRSALAQWHFDAVYASPLSRALETAQLVRPGSHVVTDPRLSEIDVGSWAGLSRDEVIAEMPSYPEHYANGVDFRRSPTGERPSEMVARAMPFFDELGLQPAGASILVVSHGQLLNRVLHALLGIEGRVLGGLMNAHFSQVLHHHGAWRLLAHNVGGSSRFVPASAGGRSTPQARPAVQ